VNARAAILMLLAVLATHGARAQSTANADKPHHRAHHPVPVVAAKAAPATDRPAPSASPVVAPPAENKGSATGLPLPRFAALRSDDVNLRAGPGTRYPIEWVYQRRNLPVEIEREFDVWRLVSDPEGVKGWVHQATLTGRRSFVVTGAERTIRAAAQAEAAPVARLRPGVVGRILHCEAGALWCEVQVQGYHGFLPRADFWGSSAGEAIN
jgi:SH3-like domain-containing protein